MSKKLITVTNNGSLGCGGHNYHAWMNEINRYLAKGNARVVSINNPHPETYKDAVAFIEINQPKTRKN